MIVEVKVAKLKPYKKNAKKHPKKQIQQVADSIKEFGFNQPIVVDKDNVVIVGHGRLEAAKLLKMETVPVMVADLTDEQANAYRLADNKLNESDWDMDLVIEELKGLQQPMIDLTGFDADLIIEPDEKDDEVPDVPDEPVSKLGDIYQLGEHRLMCGSATEIEDVEKLMDGKKADMVFTDPPYGVSYQSNMRTKTDKFDIIDNDGVFLTDWVAPVAAHSKGWVFVWTTWRVLDKWKPIVEQFGDITNMVVWHKGGGGIGDLKKTFSTDYEVAIVCNRGAELKGKRIGSVWKLKKDFAGDYLHPTQKPVELASEAIEKTTEHGESVVDVFGGSGSTLIAAEKLNRKCYMMELDPKYIDVIIKRWEDYTGQTAVKL
jgi:DNA modification methylase